MDEFSEAYEYIEKANSVTMSVGGAPAVPITPSYYTEENKGFYFALPVEALEPGKTVLIKFKTKVDLTKGTVVDGKIVFPKDVENTASLCKDTLTGTAPDCYKPIKDESNIDLSDSASINIKKNLQDMLSLSKQATNISVSGTSAYITWKIKVTVKGSVDNVNIYDYFEKEPGNVSFVTGSSSYKKGSSPCSDFTEDAVGGTDSNGTVYHARWKATNLTTGTYYIEYATLIGDFDEYCYEITPDRKNKIWADFEVPYGTGTGPGPSTITKPSLTAGTDSYLKPFMAEKQYMSYDAARGIITWKIIINPNFQPLTGVVIIEHIDNYQEWINEVKYNVGIDNLGTAYTLPSSNIDTSDPYHIKISFDSSTFDGQSGYIYVKTKITDKGIFTSNSRITLFNSATVTSPDMTDKTVIASTDNFPSPNMIEKKHSASGFDYETHTIDYEIVVNKNRQVLFGDDSTKRALVTDDLKAAHLSLPGGTADVHVFQGGSEITASLPSDAITYTEGVLKILLPIIDGTMIDDPVAEFKITYSAKVDSDYLNKEGVDKDKTAVNNTAVLSTNGLTLKSTDDYSFENKSARKKGAATADKYEAQYEIFINQAGNQLKANTKLSDTLPFGMGLELDSVKLYRVDVAKVGGAMTVKEALEKGTDYTVTYKDNVMTVTLLTARTDCLKLTYRVKLLVEPSLVPTDSFENQFSLTGYEGTETLNGSFSLDKNSWSKVKRSSIYCIAVLKKDKITGDPLPGATFTLYDGDTKVVSIKTDSTGHALFVFSKKDKDKTFKIAETAAPAGYKIDSKAKVSATPVAGMDEALKDANVIVFTDTPEGASIVPPAEDPEDPPLGGGDDPDPDPDPIGKYRLRKLGKHKDHDIIDKTTLPEGCTFEDLGDGYVLVKDSEGLVLGVVKRNGVMTGDETPIGWIVLLVAALITIRTVLSIMLKKKQH